MKRLCESLPEHIRDELENDWRAGVLPFKVIANKYGVDPDDLKSFADKNNWNIVSMSAAITRSSTKALIDRAVSEDDRERGITAPVVTNFVENVERYGQIVANIVETHKGDLKTAREYASKIVRDLRDYEGPKIDPAAIEGIAALIAQQDPDLAKKLMSWPEPVGYKEQMNDFEQRARVLSMLANTMEKIIKCERDALGLDKPGGQGAGGYDDFLDEILKSKNKSKLKLVK